jgi:DNA-nicking Smr family endonuclease
VNHDDDLDSFVAAMRDVKPLQFEQRVVPTQRRPRPRARNSRLARDELLAESLHGPAEPSTDGIEQLGEGVAFRSAAVPKRVFRLLRSGSFSIEDEVDLHGFSAHAAKRVLREFIVGSAKRQLGCVRVVHGKGLRSGPAGPILKGSVQHWLSQWEEVLAFVSTRPRDGGSGALYVLLRRR